MKLLYSMTALIVLSLSVYQHGCELKKQDERITLAVAVQPISAPVFVAIEKGFFEQQGLQVTLQKYLVGKDALESVVNGAADFCTVAETPFMYAVLKDAPIAIIASIADSGNYMKIVAKKNSNITSPQDLRGKDIGVTLGTNAPYFLHTYLTFYGISNDEVRQVPLKPERMVEELANGTIDAAVSWSPHTAQQQKRLGANAVILENRHVYELSWNIVSRRDSVKTRSEAVKRLLRALIQAQYYIVEHLGEAQAIAARWVGKDAALTDINFDVRLGQAQILSLEEQARWAIASGVTDKKTIPNFLNMIYFEGLESVAPDSVTVVHK